MSNSNPLMCLPTGSRSTPLLSEKITYIGQLDSYEKGSEIAGQLLGLEVSDSRIYRITDAVGEHAGGWLGEEDLHETLGEDTAVYAQVDGSMVLTREEAWKEVKLGRVFGAKDLYVETGTRNWLKNSEYVACLGGHSAFEEAMSRVLDRYEGRGEGLVFIGDGARWQWNWAGAEYPRATQILDFYHGMGHIGSFVSLLMGEPEKKGFMEAVGHCLKNEGVDACWEKLDGLECRTKTQKSEKVKLKTYIDNNRARMDYPAYLERGLLIGSGAIESAHRTVIQRRMKLSGQRWSKKGAANMLNIRTLNMSGHWDRVQKFYRQAA